MALLDTLRSRGLPQATYLLRAVPSLELRAAQRAAEQAQAQLREAEANRTVTTERRRAAREATDRLHACFTALTIRAMLPDELEALIGEHKPTDDDRDGAIFHHKTFMPALLGQCVFESPDAPEPAMTADQWNVEISKGSMSLGEVGHLFAACWEINDRSPDPDLPKG